MVNFVFKDKTVIFAISANQGYFDNLVESKILQDILGILDFNSFESKLVFNQLLLPYQVFQFTSQISNPNTLINPNTKRKSYYIYLCSMYSEKKKKQMQLINKNILVSTETRWPNCSFFPLPFSPLFPLFFVVVLFTDNVHILLIKNLKTPCSSLSYSQKKKKTHQTLSNFEP